MLVVTAFALVFFYAPLDADQGFIQKIFYLHVPLAIVALIGFVVGGVFAVLHLRGGNRRWDAMVQSSPWTASLCHPKSPTR